MRREAGPTRGRQKGTAPPGTWRRSTPPAQAGSPTIGHMSSMERPTRPVKARGNKQQAHAQRPGDGINQSRDQSRHEVEKAGASRREEGRAHHQPEQAVEGKWGATARRRHRPQPRPRGQWLGPRRPGTHATRRTPPTDHHPPAGGGREFRHEGGEQLGHPCHQRQGTGGRGGQSGPSKRGKHAESQSRQEGARSGQQQSGRQQRARAGQEGEGEGRGGAVQGRAGQSPWLPPPPSTPQPTRRCGCRQGAAPARCWHGPGELPAAAAAAQRC